MNQPYPASRRSSGRPISKSSVTALGMLLVGACLFVPAQAQFSTARSGKKAIVSAKHPKVAPGQECSECHRQQTKDWDAGPHGQNLVKCLVCHGAVEEGFMAKPPVSRCESCHDRQVAQLKSAFMKGKSCFTCHPPHALKPHQLGGEGR
jgi:hypothetical protein